MAILVTGGAGFIGSNLLDRLAQGSEELVCWDDFNDYYDPRIKRGNVAPLLEKGRVRLYEGDICDVDLGEKIFGENKIQTVVHLAARAGVRPSLKEPLLYERVNSFGTTALLELARRHEVERFVFGSSSSVYGNSRALPFSENDPVDAPISPYAVTKRAAELMCHTYCKVYGMKMVCLRFFTVYGPRGRPDMAIYLFTDKMERGEEIVMYGDGSTRRDYTFVSDILDGLEGAMRFEGGFEIVNLGESRTTELRRLIEIVSEATGKTPKIRRMPMQPGDVDATYADITKAKKLLGYNPGFPIEKGIPLFVEWYREHVKA
jgi:UDP-glucuronate 4-epimerase